MINLLRKNIGTIAAAFGFILLCVLTFGDIGDVLTEAYWINVKNNLTSIGFLSVSLMMIQVSIKQGIGEQALQKGLNTENTSNKYKEHRIIINRNNERMIYMPYFLQIYNERHTKLRKREFLVDNNFSSEEALYNNKKKSLIKKYENIHVYMTASRIKWATTDILYNKYGQIITLAEHRTKRAIKGAIKGFVFMIGATLLTRGLFFEESDIPLWAKFVKLLSYVVMIMATSIFTVLREYEKGAFGVPNELEEINEIWREFESWKVPKWVADEIIELNLQKEVKDEQIKEIAERSNSRTDIQTEQKESEMAKNIGTDNVLDITNN